MKYMAVALILAFVAGCGTTQTVERSLDDAGIAQAGRLCSDSCAATLSYSTHFNVDDPVDEDSLYERLRGSEITLRLSDSRVLRGRLWRLAREPEKWAIGQVSDWGSTVDTVQFPFSSVESIVGASQASNLRHEQDKLLVDGQMSLPISSLHEIVISQTRQLRSRGGFIGAGVGAVAGAAAGALIGLALVCTCEGSECQFGECYARPDSPSEGAGAGALIGGVIGGVAGLVVGAITGTKETTIYRFRPDTPQQMSVVIGVGPGEK